MTIQILLPTPLQPYAGKKDSVTIENAETVGEALNHLMTQYKDLRRHLFDEKGNVRSFVNVFIGENDIRHLQGLQTKVKSGDELMIIPSVAGGY